MISPTFEIKFDCICLSEIWNYNLDFYKNIFNDYVSFFKPPEDSNIGADGIFVKKNYKSLRKLNSNYHPLTDEFLKSFITERDKVINITI